MKCGKTTFASRLEAARCAARLRRKQKGHDDLRAYFCKRCRGFHVGHRRYLPEQAERRRRRAIATGGVR